MEIIELTSSQNANVSTFNKSAFKIKVAARTINIEMSDYGQIYLLIKFDDLHIDFILSRGIETSFFGGIAARTLATTLMSWFEQIPTTLKPDNLDQSLLHSIENSPNLAKKIVDNFNIPENLPNLLRQALEIKRAYGSECSFSSGRIDLPTDDLPQGRMFFAWAGDNQLNIWGPGEKETDNFFGDNFNPDQKWSSNTGLTDGIVHVVSGPLINQSGQQQVTRIFCCTDNFKKGFANFPHQISDHELDETLSFVSKSSENDVAFIEIAVANTKTLWDTSDETQRFILKTATSMGYEGYISKNYLALYTGYDISCEAQKQFNIIIHQLLEKGLISDLGNENIVISTELWESVKGYEFPKIKEKIAENILSVLQNTLSLEWFVNNIGLDFVIDQVSFAYQNLSIDNKTFLQCLEFERGNIMEGHTNNFNNLFLQQWRNRCFEMGLNDVSTKVDEILEQRQKPYIKQLNILNKESENLARIIITDGKPLCISPDGLWGISYSNRLFNLYNFEEGKRKLSFPCDDENNNYRGYPTVCHIDNKNEFFIFGLNTGFIVRHDLLKGDLMWFEKAHANDISAIAISADSKFIATGSNENEIKIWDLNKGVINKTLKTKYEMIESLAISNDCNSIAVISKHASYNLVKQCIEVWDINTDELLNSVEDYRMKSIVFAEDNESILYLSIKDTNSIKQWFFKENLSKIRVEAPQIVTYVYYNDGIFFGDRLGNIYRNDVNEFIGKHCSEITSIRLNKKLNCVISASEDSSFKVWDAISAMKTFGHDRKVIGLVSSPDHRWITSFSDDKTINVWDENTMSLISTIAKHVGYQYSNSITAMSTNGELFFCYGQSRDTIRAYDLPAFDHYEDFKGHTASINDIALSPDNEWLATVSNDKTLRVWSLTDGKCYGILVALYALTCIIWTDNKKLVIGDDFGGVRFLEWCFSESIIDQNDYLNPNIPQNKLNDKKTIDYISRGEHQKAISYCTEALKTKPNDSNIYNYRAFAYCEIGQNEKALRDCEIAISLNPNLAAAYVNRGRAYANLKRFDLALYDLNKAIKINSELSQAYNRRGIVYFDLGGLDQAYHDINQAINLDPNNGSAYYHRSLLDLALNKSDFINDRKTAYKLGFRCPSCGNLTLLSKENNYFMSGVCETCGFEIIPVTKNDWPGQNRNWFITDNAKTIQNVDDLIFFCNYYPEIAITHLLHSQDFENWFSKIGEPILEKVARRSRDITTPWLMNEEEYDTYRLNWFINGIKRTKSEKVSNALSFDSDIKYQQNANGISQELNFVRSNLLFVLSEPRKRLIDLLMKHS